MLTIEVFQGSMRIKSVRDDQGNELPFAMSLVEDEGADADGVDARVQAFWDYCVLGLTRRVDLPGQYVEQHDAAPAGAYQFSDGHAPYDEGLPCQPEGPRILMLIPMRCDVETLAPAVSASTGAVPQGADSGPLMLDADPFPPTVSPEQRVVLRVVRGHNDMWLLVDAALPPAWAAQLLGWMTAPGRTWAQAAGGVQQRAERRLREYAEEMARNAVASPDVLDLDRAIVRYENVVRRGDGGSAVVYNRCSCALDGHPAILTRHDASASRVVVLPGATPDRASRQWATSLRACPSRLPPYLLTAAQLERLFEGVGLAPAGGGLMAGRMLLRS